RRRGGEARLRRGRHRAGDRRRPCPLEPRRARPAPPRASRARRNAAAPETRRPMTTAPALHVVASAEPQKRNIIAVASGKGGVGKTWFSITLTHALAKRGARTLLFDGDLGLANVDVQLGITPERDLSSVIAGQIPMQKAVTRHAGGFDIVAGRSGSGSLATLSATRLMSLRTELQAFAQ